MFELVRVETIEQRDTRELVVLTVRPLLTTAPP